MLCDLPSAAVAGRGHRGFGVAVRALDAARAAVVAVAADNAKKGRMYLFPLLKMEIIQGTGRVIAMYFRKASFLQLLVSTH